MIKPPVKSAAAKRSAVSKRVSIWSLCMVRLVAFTLLGRGIVPRAVAIR